VLYFIPQPRCWDCPGGGDAGDELAAMRLLQRRGQARPGLYKRAFEALLRSDARLGAGASLTRTAASSTARALRRSEVVNLKSSVLQKYVKRPRE
jgi:hypothetical protein